MFKSVGRLLGTLLCVATIAAPAAAREDYCLVPGTNQIDVRATQTLRQIAAQQSPRYMGLLTGVWFSRSSTLNQVSDLWERYEAGGFYSYHNRVCGGLIPACSHYQGIGVFAVRAARAQNTFLGLVSVSDLNRNHQCTSLSGRFINRNTFVRPSGQIVRRVQ